MHNNYVFLRILYLPKFYLYLFFIYLLDLFLEYNFGDTYFKRVLFLPVILHAQFFGSKLYDSIILQDNRKMHVKLREDINDVNIIKLKYFYKGKNVNNLKI